MCHGPQDAHYIKVWSVRQAGGARELLSKALLYSLVNKIKVRCMLCDYVAKAAARWALSWVRIVKLRDAGTPDLVCQKLLTCR